MNEYLLVPGSICAIAASELSTDTVWFIKIESEEEICDKSITDDYGHTVVHGHKFFKGRYLEKSSSKKNHDVYKPMNKMTFIHTASVVYPFVNYEQTKKGHYSIPNTELCEIIAYVEHYNFSTDSD